MQKRNVRLKEFLPNVRRTYVPSDAYLDPRPALARGQGYLVQTDGFGYVTHGRSRNCQGKIVLLGGSFIEGIYVHESERLSAVVEEELLGNGYPYDVYNAGVSGATNLNIYNSLVNKIIYDQPEAVVIVTSSNDMAALRYKDGYRNGSKFHGNTVPESLEEWAYDSIDDNFDQIDFMLSLMDFTCKRRGIKLFLCTFPEIKPNAELTKINQAVRTYCKANDVDLIDIDAHLPKDDRLYYDKLHVNSDGAKIAGEIIVRALSDKLMIGPNLSTFDRRIVIARKQLSSSAIEWSDWHSISLNSNHVASASLTIKCVSKEARKHKALVVSLEFDEVPEFQGDHCYFYANSSGWHFYVDVAENLVQDITVPISIPSNLNSFRIGLRTFDESTKVELNCLSLSIVSVSSDQSILM